MGKVTLIIEFDPSTGSVALAGAPDNRLLVYGLLEFAKEIALRQAMQQENGARIVVPTLVPPSNLKSS